MILLIVLFAVIVGLVAAIAIIGHGPNVHTTAEKMEAYVLGVLAISLGWFLVHTIYTFRYAHLYWYDDDGDGSECGGINFPGTEQPSDWDFAYFAFCIGTSFAVSDPQVTETRVRSEVIGHSIISFAYNSVIVGMVINLFAGIFAAAAGRSKAERAMRRQRVEQRVDLGGGVVAVRRDANAVRAVGRDDLRLGQALAERDRVDAVTCETRRCPI